MNPTNQSALPPVPHPLHLNDGPSLNEPQYNNFPPPQDKGVPFNPGYQIPPPQPYNFQHPDMINKPQIPKPKILGMDLQKALLGFLVASFILRIIDMIVSHQNIINGHTINIGPFITAAFCLFGIYAVWKLSRPMMKVYFWLSIIGMIIEVVILITVVAIVSRVDFEKQLMRSCNSNFKDQPFNGVISVNTNDGIKNCEDIMLAVKRALIIGSVLIGTLLLFQSFILFQLRRLINYVVSIKFTSA